MNILSEKEINKLEMQLASAKQARENQIKHLTFKQFDTEKSKQAKHRKTLINKVFTGTSSAPTIPIKIRKKKKGKAVPIRSDDFGACSSEKNRRALPVPDGCLQATLVLLAEQFDWSNKRCNLFAKQLGKSETVSMARNKFNKYDDIGKLWGKQKQKAVEYLNINYTVLNTIIPTI